MTNLITAGVVTYLWKCEFNQIKQAVLVRKVGFIIGIGRCSIKYEFITESLRPPEPHTLEEQISQPDVKPGGENLPKNT